MKDRHGQVAVLVRLPKDLVKQIDHLRIDLEVRTRQEMVVRIIEEWLHDRGHADPLAGHGAEAR